MTIHSQLAQLEGLCELQRRFNAHVANAREPYRVALFRLMETYHLHARCCEDADIDWKPKIESRPNGEYIYVEWSCRVHGSGEGIYIPVKVLANQLLA